MVRLWHSEWNATEQQALHGVAAHSMRHCGTHAAAQMMMMMLLPGGHPCVTFG
jgi:hypothetical protein